MPVTTTLTQEITATSRINQDEAVRQAISLATAGRGEIERVEITSVEALIEDGGVAGYRVTLKVTHSGEDDPTSEREEGSIRLWSRSYPPAPPLVTDEDGAMRVGGTRVTLDSVIAAFREVETAEGIAQRYPPLRPTVVRIILDHYSSHKDDLDAYVADRENEAASLREQVEADPRTTGLRDRLTARRSGER